MGNEHFRIKKTDEQRFKEAVREMQTQKQKHMKVKQVSFPDKKYRSHLLNVLQSTKFEQQFKENFQQTIKTKISQEQLMNTLYGLNSIKKNSLSKETTLLRTTIDNELQTSKRVRVNFDIKLMEKKKKNLESQYESLHQERTQEGRIKKLQHFLKKQIQTKYHPFSKLCKTFADLIYHSKWGEQSENEQIYEEKEKFLSTNIRIFCNFMIDGCFHHYEKWILEYSNFDKNRYRKWLYCMVIQKIWIVNNNYLYKIVTSTLNSFKIPLKIDVNEIANLSPTFFSIHENFQIGGNYFQTIFRLSQLTTKQQPFYILRHLEIIKNCICRDIDNYHTLEKTGEIYEIDSDNILGIVGYILCKVGQKIEQIYVQLLFLRVIYGENIYFNYDVSSYMYSTIISAFEYLEQVKEKNQIKLSQSKLSTDGNFENSIKQ